MVLFRQHRPFSALHRPEHGHPSDPRPPWVFRAGRLITVVIAPSILFYAVFFVDFGEREHVFTPVRRWATRQKAAFFTLTPDERTLLESTGPGSTEDKDKDV